MKSTKPKQKPEGRRGSRRAPAGDNGALLRQPILDVARELFAKEGYESVSMRRIGVEVGCSPMAMYRYFQSKEELLISICEDTFARAMQARNMEAEKQKTPIDRLRAAVRTFIEFGISHPNHYKLTFMTDMPSGPLARRKAAVVQKALDDLRSKVRECVTQNALDVDVELTTQVLRVGAQGMISGSIIKAFACKDQDRVMEKLIQSLTRDLE